MGEVLSREEIEQRFVSEWILLEDPETTPMYEVLRGKVLWHSKDRDEVYDKALQLRPKDSAILYTGTIPDGMAIIL